MNWIIETILVHLMFLGSIFVIYFRSPVIQNLHPMNDLVDPPAKRLVLFVADGLRADSFFSENCTNIPLIKEIFLNQGMVGISHTRVPTESRPGHIALIAGLYEDPTAILKGWRENPVDFDSVFNRSATTYAWGANDILSIFAKGDRHHKIKSVAYTDQDFSENVETFKFDTWVFSRVSSFLRDHIKQLKNASRNIFFLHLLGMDTAGHVHKPGSLLFNENLKVVDHGIAETYQLFEEMFPDRKTAYVLTSDHGMTDKGSHGAGDNYETETPIVAWGAGIKNWKNLQHKDNWKIKRNACGEELSSFDIEQADIAPLMASLVGVAIPVNNYGKLPWNLLNATHDYIALAMRNNALQMFEQYAKLYGEFQRGWFSGILRSFDKIDIEQFRTSTQLISKGNREENDSSLLIMFDRLVDTCLEGIEYFQTYYQRLLLFCTTIAFLCWILHLIVLVESRKVQPTFSSPAITAIGFVLIVLLATFVYLQGIAFGIGAYFIFPIICWIRAMQKIRFNVLCSALSENWRFLLGMVIIAELLVFTFFKREAISLAVLAYMIYQHSIFKNIRHIEAYKSLYYEWIITGTLLLIFPNIPLGYLRKNDFLLMFGGLLWITKLCLTIRHIRDSNLLQFFCFIGFANCLICLYFERTGLYGINLVISWLLSVISIVGPIFSDATLKHRTASVFFYFGIPYFHLSIGYEMIFYVLLGSHILSFIELNATIDQQIIPNTIKRSEKSGKLGENLNISLAMLLFVFLSFFGTGNIASISSFDPGAVRFFVTTFSPFVMMSLIILKLAIPLVLVIAAFTGLTHRKKINENQVFLSLLIICDIMGLNFLFMVTNKGSWLEIGTSISHFVIMEVTTLVFAIVSYVSKILLFVDVSKMVRLKTGKLI